MKPTTRDSRKHTVMQVFDRSSAVPSRKRRGIAAIWVIVTVPVLLIAFGVTLDIANQWMARVELENALEASAQAAVKEWAESGDMGTLAAREIGVNYAAANTIRCVPTEIATNWDPNATADNPNQNLSCDITQADPENSIGPGGNLIFGSFFEENGEDVFDAGIRPQCGNEMVLFDASDQGNLAATTSWGVSFYQKQDTPLDLRIDRVVIDLRASGNTGSFTGVFQVTQPGDQPKVNDQSQNSQPNIEGFPNPNAQIVFENTAPGILTIRFFADPNGNDLGFEPGDRFRFAAGVTNVSSGNGSDDGDGIGRDGASATVFFDAPGLVDVPFTGFFLDNMETSNDCINPAMVDPITGSLIVNPTELPDLPCPPSSAPGNNGQSYALVGAGGRNFAVRAQATVPVRLLTGTTFRFPFSTYCVTARVTAVYDCGTGKTRLVRVDRFICP